MRLVLASTSPRRRELLATLGFPFEVAAPCFEERPTSLAAGEEALYFAEQKARSVAPLYPSSLIIVGDTLIDCGGTKLGQPQNPQKAVGMLELLSGKKHLLYTAVVLLDTLSGRLEKHLERVSVTFRPLSRIDIEKYVASGEAMGKAGAYAVQGKGASLIEKMEGDRDAVIGLPLRPLRQWLKR